MSPAVEESAIVETTKSGSPVASIGHAAVLGVIGSVATVIVAIIRSKVTAHYLGSAGVGAASEIQQLVTLFNIPVAMVVGPALVTALSRASAKQDYPALRTTCSAAATLGLASSATAGGIAVVATYATIPESLGHGLWWLAIPAAVGAILTALLAIPGQLLTASGRLRELTALSVGGGLLQAAMSIAGTALYGLRGQFIAVVLGPLLILPLSFWVVDRALPDVAWKPRLAFDMTFAKDAFRTGATTLIAGLALQSALVMIRTRLDGYGGAETVGQFQAAWAIGTTYFGAVLSGVGAFAFPRYAAAETTEELTAEVRNASNFVIRSGPPVILAAIASRRLILRVLYNHQFDPAADVVGLMMVADIAKAFVWVNAGPLLYRGRVREYLIVESCTPLLLGAGSRFLIGHFGLAGVGYAAISASVIAGAASAIVLRISCAVPIDFRYVALTILATLMAAGAAAAPASSALLQLPAALVALLWAHRTGVLAELISTFRRRLKTALRAFKPETDVPHREDPR